MENHKEERTFLCTIEISKWISIQDGYVRWMVRGALFDFFFSNFWETF